MRIKPFMNITGVILILNDQDGTECGQLKLHSEDLSDIAIACIRQLGMDAPQPLTELCRQVSASCYGGDDPMLPAFPDLVRADDIRAWFMDRGFYGRELGCIMNLSWGATVSIAAIMDKLNTTDIVEHILRIPNTGRLTAGKVLKRVMEHGWITDREVARKVTRHLELLRSNTE